ncbi:MAG TPA: hypothetical protein DGT21_13705 [Armatimonadetes bacterium]|jgi:hypothetical protein|nr:hypothetical protein [Armatimonadota bacterium]
MATDVSIVIVNWNTKEDLRAAVASCLAHPGELNVRVIVVDNASTDGSADMVREQFPDVTLIANDDNLGYTVGCNQGMRAAEARYYLMLNSDAELTDGCLPELVRVMDTHPELGCVSPRLVYPDGSPQVACGSFPRLWVRLLPVSLIVRIELARTAAFERPGEFYPVDYVFGACNLVRADAVVKAGMMDERIFMWCDDAEWQKRMRAAGYQSAVVNGATCIHRVGTSTSLVSEIRRSLRNSMSEFTYFRLRHGRLATALLWLVRTLYSLVKVLILAPARILTAGRVQRIRTGYELARWRLWFHIAHAPDILWREPRPYRAEDVTPEAR